MTEKTSLPPIGDLFRASWETFKKNLLNLFLLFLISLGIYIGIVFVFALILVALGVSTTLLNPQINPANAIFSNPISVIGFMLTLIVVIVSFITVGLIFQIATFRLIYHSDKKESLMTLIKTSKPYIWPVFVVSF